MEKGQKLNVLELAQLAPNELRTMLQSFMGGQWQNDTAILRIPYYRPLDRSIRFPTKTRGTASHRTNFFPG